MSEELMVGEERQIVCRTNPASEVDFNYSYSTDNETVVEVTPAGVIKAKAPGVTMVTVTDLIFGYKTQINVIVGQKDGIHASINDNENLVDIDEDSTIVINVNVTDSTNFKLYKYSNAKYGNYYIRNNKKRFIRVL